MKTAMFIGIFVVLFVLVAGVTGWLAYALVGYVRLYPNEGVADTFATGAILMALGSAIAGASRSKKGK